MHGYIPHTIQQLSGLKELRLEGNAMTGHIPQTLGNCGSIETLSIQKNSFIGVIPPQVCALSKDKNLTNLAADCKTGYITCECCDECY